MCLPLTRYRRSVERLATETSHPEWLVKEWADAYGFEAAEKFAGSISFRRSRRSASIRMKSDRAELLAQMDAEGIEVEKGDLAEDAVKLLKGTIAVNSFLPRTAKYPSKMKAQC